MKVSPLAGKPIEQRHGDGFDQFAACVLISAMLSQWSTPAS